MVSSCQGNSVRKSYFISQQEAYSLYRIITPINIVTKKQIVSVWGFSSNGKQLNKIVELPMYIAADSYRGLDELGVGLFEEYLFGFIYYKFNIFLSQWFKTP